MDAGAADDRLARRWFFQSVLPDQLIRDQLDLEAAAADGFVTIAQSLDQVRAGLAALGAAALIPQAWSAAQTGAVAPGAMVSHKAA